MLFDSLYYYNNCSKFFLLLLKIEEGHMREFPPAFHIQNQDKKWLESRWAAKHINTIFIIIIIIRKMHTDVAYVCETHRKTRLIMKAGGLRALDAHKQTNEWERKRTVPKVNHMILVCDASNNNNNNDTWCRHRITAQSYIHYLYFHTFSLSLCHFANTSQFIAWTLIIWWKSIFPT